MTWATRHPHGFSDAHLELLEAIHPALSVLIEVYLQRVVMGTVLRTYLGADAGERVLRGQIRRGDRQTIRAALWFSDLRDFTVLSARLSPDELVATLNECFGPLTAAVQAHGGQVLKFMGDGMMAIFPDVADGGVSGGACGQALKAALAARASLDETNRARLAAGREALNFGLGLHYGDAMYGNVGAPDRLDFTVIGPAVNRASRIESQCKTLGRWLLVSSEFAERCGQPLTPLGPQHLKGISEPVEVFGLVGG
jgi:adenylate cyclase